METLNGPIQQFNQTSEKYHQDLVDVSPVLDEMVSKLLAGESKGNWFMQSLLGAFKLIFKNSSGLVRAGIAVAGSGGVSIYLKSIFQGAHWMWFAGGILAFLLLCFYAVMLVYQKMMLDISSNEFNLAFFKKKRAKEYELYWKPMLDRKVSFRGLKEFVTPLLKGSADDFNLRELNRELQESNALLKDKIHQMQRDAEDFSKVINLAKEYETLFDEQLLITDHISIRLKRLTDMLQRLVNKGQLRIQDLLMVFERGFVIYESTDTGLKLIADEGTTGRAYEFISFESDCIEADALRSGWAERDNKLAVKVVTASRNIWILVIDYDTMLGEGNELIDVVLDYCQCVVSLFSYVKTPEETTTIDYNNSGM
ncbi:hypothetical protein [Paenibacillus sp. GXUN7292]|uniref:hypothetical protein n=1 Tax=Paenibacillus sp. GXUN7292 TaxID=3422499 RepID=UPI003D7EE4AF